MENTKNKQTKVITDQDVLCDVIALMESRGVTKCDDISYLCSLLLSSDKIRGVKRSLTVQRQKVLKHYVNIAETTKCKSTARMAKKVAAMMEPSSKK